MTVRRIIAFLAFSLWAVLTFLTFYVLFTDGPDVLVFFSLIIVATMGIGIFGALNDKRDGRR